MYIGSTCSSGQHSMYIINCTCSTMSTHMLTRSGKKEHTHVPKPTGWKHKKRLAFLSKKPSEGCWPSSKPSRAWSDRFDRNHRGVTAPRRNRRPPRMVRVDRWENDGVRLTLKRLTSPPVWAPVVPSKVGLGWVGAMFGSSCTVPEEVRLEP